MMTTRWALPAFVLTWMALGGLTIYGWLNPEGLVSEHWLHSWFQLKLGLLVISAILIALVIYQQKRVLNALADAIPEMVQHGVGFQIRDARRIGEEAEMFNRLSRRLADTLEEIERDRSLSREALNRVDGVILVVDGKGCIELATSCVERISGWQQTQLLNHPVALILPQYGETARRIMETGSGASEAGVVDHTVMRCENGQTLTVEVRFQARAQETGFVLLIRNRPAEQTSARNIRRLSETGTDNSVQSADGVPDAPRQDPEKVEVSRRPGDVSVSLAFAAIHETAPRNILVADDDAACRSQIEQMLSEEGHLVTPVENGLEALDTLQCSDFDLVLMDISMPVMDGLAATRSIRQLGLQTSHIPIIAMTRQDTPEAQASYLAAGMNGAMCKPVNRDRLLAVLDQYAAFEFQEPPILLEALPECLASEGTEQVDLNALKQTAMGIDSNALPRLIAAFVTNVREQYPVISDALQHQDHKRLMREMHCLRDSAATYGLVRIQQLAMEIEQRCKAGESHRVAEPASRLLNELEPALVQLEQTDLSRLQVS